MSLDERPRGSTRPTPKVHHNSLPKTSIEGALEDLIKESTEKANALKDELAKEWGINPACGKQLIEHFELEARHGWPKTKGGKPKTAIRRRAYPGS